MKINSDEIRRLGETQTVELKKSLSLQREALEALCGMINSDSATGTVIFGVSPDGNICGVEEGSPMLANAVASFGLSVNISVARCHLSRNVPQKERAAQLTGRLFSRLLCT